MKEENKKRIIMLTIAVLVGMAIGGLAFGVGHTSLPEIVSGDDEIPEIEVELSKDEGILPVEEKEVAKNDKKDEEPDVNSASKEVLENVTKRDKRIAELQDKYNDEVYGKVAYYLELAQKYSLPICFIGIAMGCFNFLIIGNKKLDKKEQGFGWIVGFTIGLVVFNVIPLLFALIVAGR